MPSVKNDVCVVILVMSLSEVQYAQNKDISDLEHDCLIIINLQSIQNYEVVEYKFSKSSSDKIHAVDSSSG